MFSISSDRLDVETRLSAPDLPEGHALYPVLASALRSRPAPGIETSRMHEPADRPYWPASFFGLDQAIVYRDSNEAERRAILLGCCRNILAELYYIEKCGMYFASKMCLLSESAQERMLYCIFAADEAVHFNWISGYVSAESVKGFAASPFIRLLDQVLRNEDRTTLRYIVQVILEGWGISHYHALAKNCLDDALSGVFENIIRDEGRHHSSGATLFNERQHDADILKRLADLLAQLLSMVQAGPQMVVSQIERVKGRMPRELKICTFAELDCEASSLSKIKSIQSLIRTAAGAGVILSELERKGSFRAYTASEAAGQDGKMRRRAE